MKIKLLAATFLAVSVCTAAASEPPEMRMTTEIPEGISTPDKVETRVGTFALRDGIPTPESINDVYDYLDFHNGVQALSLIHI